MLARELEEKAGVAKEELTELFEQELEEVEDVQDVEENDVIDQQYVVA